MKKIGLGLLYAGLIAFVSPLHAASPSSVAAGNGAKPSTVQGNGGFDFSARDKGAHTGWCKGQGHLAAPGNKASGHRNHAECDNGGDGDDGGGTDGGNGDPPEECVVLGISCDS